MRASAQLLLDRSDALHSDNQRIADFLSTYSPATFAAFREVKSSEYSRQELLSLCDRSRYITYTVSSWVRTLPLAVEGSRRGGIISTMASLLLNEKVSKGYPALVRSLSI